VHKCPKCKSERITLCDHLPSGSDRFQCLDCKKKFVPEPKKVGRKRKKVKNKTGFDPIGCQAAMGIRQTGMLPNEKDAQKRYKRGDTQVLCAICDRWRWGDTRCKDFSPEKK